MSLMQEIKETFGAPLTEEANKILKEIVTTIFKSEKNMSAEYIDVYQLRKQLHYLMKHDDRNLDGLENLVSRLITHFEQDFEVELTVEKPLVICKTLKDLINCYDELVIDDQQLGLGDIGELKEAIECAIENGENFLTLPESITRSEVEEFIFFSGDIK